MIRYARLDALRGAAVVWMAAFHLSFDLNHFGWWQPRQDFYHDPWWTLQRTAILSLFLWCAGVGQAVACQSWWTDAARSGNRWTRAFWRRWVQIAGCAVLVSLGSAWMFPHSWISFGVLHGMAVMLLLVRCAAAWSNRAIAVVSVCMLVVPWVLSHPLFDQRWWQWVGLVTRKPVTEDFVPVLPWCGVMGLGLLCGRWMLRHRPHWLRADLPRVMVPLAGLGRWSLSFYMLHQPVFIGLILAWSAWWGAGGTMRP